MKQHFINYYTLPMLFLSFLRVYSEESKLVQDINLTEDVSITKQTINTTLPHVIFSKKNKRKKFTFNFSEKPVLEIVQEIATLLDINILLPQGALAIPPNLKLTINQAVPLGISQAWKELTAILELAGYTIIVDGNSIEIHKIDQNIARQPMNLYVDPHPDTMIDSQEIIRCIFYLTNLNVKASWSDLNGMLKDILSQTADIRADNKANAIILTDKASNIKAALKILQALEQAGVPDTIEVLPLYYVSAQLVDDLFNKQLLANRQNVSPGSPTQQDQAFYFPKQTKVVALSVKNSIVVAMIILTLIVDS